MEECKSEHRDRTTRITDANGFVWFGTSTNQYLTGLLDKAGRTPHSKKKVVQYCCGETAMIGDECSKLGSRR